MITLAVSTLGGTSLISLLIWLLILACVIYVVFLILGMLPIPAQVKTIITVILGLIFLLVLVERLGLL